MRWVALLLCGGLALASATAANCGGYHVEYAFGAGGDGIEPVSSPTKYNGDLYGATLAGGADGIGSIYTFDEKIGTEAVVYSFPGKPGSAFPEGGLTQYNGLFYGVTFDGGNLQNCDTAGCGTIFSFNPTTHLKVDLHLFQGAADGGKPFSGLIERGGILFGVTFYGGGSTNCGPIGCGTVFSFDPATGAETVLHAFTGGSDGAGPLSVLISVKGKLYGTTADGGGSANCGSLGCGVVFSVDPTTGAEAVVHAFQGGVDGSSPSAGLTNVGDKLYGTTAKGGGSCSVMSAGCGTVFSLDMTTGDETIVHAFEGSGRDGYDPVSALVYAGGMLYGTTSNGSGRVSHSGLGILFSIDPTTGAETILHVFRGGADGEQPNATLTYIGHKFYGTTTYGGGSGHGTLYSFIPQ